MIAYLAMRTEAWTPLRLPWHTRVASVPKPSKYIFFIALMKSFPAAIVVSNDSVNTVHETQIVGITTAPLYLDVVVETEY